MTTQAFNEILERHVRLALVPQMKNPLNRFAVGAALGAGRLKAEAMRPQLEALGVLEGDEIDTERLRDALRGGFDQTPEISVFGFKFTRDDADAFLKALGVGT